MTQPQSEHHVCVKCGHEFDAPFGDPPAKCKKCGNYNWDGTHTYAGDILKFPRGRNKRD